jgi:hypothetical protein
MRSAFAYRYDEVRTVRAFFGAVVLLSFLTTTSITMILPLFAVDHGNAYMWEVEQDSLRSNKAGEVPVTVVRLPSDHKRMTKQAFPETAVLPPKQCSFTMEQIESNRTGMDTATRTRNRPIWVPGYPGSGSELLRDLVQTMTGDVAAAADIYKDVVNRCRKAVTCKTHWPSYPHHAPEQYHAQQQQQQHNQQQHHVFAPNVILLLRNPATALASHFNFKWETANSVADHTAQAPQADWMVWRNARFDRQIKNWKDMILQWHHADSHGHGRSLNAYYHVTLYVAYERLVSPNLSKGPIMAVKLADELRRAGATSVVAAADIPCVWRTVVLDQPRKQRHRNGQPQDRYQPSYTVEQQQIMGDMLQGIMFQLPDRVELNEILTEYLYEIRANLHIDD